MASKLDRTRICSYLLNLGCKAEIFTAETGQFGLNGYPERFSCRWEIKADPGSQIKVYIITGSMEARTTCSYADLIFLDFGTSG